ncbi:MAG TPA: S9 family peptidase [Lysobacter sp.]|nr:S9 family peptidase [Lysobacter sp.]
MRKPAHLAHAICLTLCLAPVAFAQEAAPSNDTSSSAGDANAPLTLDRVMADPDWIGAPIEQAWWSWDGQRAYTQRKRTGATIRDVYVQPIAGGTATVLDGSARATEDAAQPVYDAQHARMAFVRNGDVFVRDLRSGALQQLTRTNDEEAQPQWASDGGLAWRVGNAWYRWTSAGGVRQAALVLAEKAPGGKPESDDLRDRQMRLFDTLRNDRAQRDAARAQNDLWQKSDPTRAPAPAYMGADVDIADSSMSPDGRWLLVVTTEKGADIGTSGKMPKYITESGYEEFEEVRTRVGRNNPLPQRLWLVDVGNASVRELKFDTLPGIKTDPLAALRKAAGKPALEGDRAVQVLTSGDNSGGPSIRWSQDGHQAAVMIRAVDNKDRWIAGVDFAGAKLLDRHRLTDPAWINWGFNDFGFAPDGALWFLSEESGWSHLYVSDGNGAPRAITSGKWEASQPQLSADGKRFLFLCNRAWPGDYEVCEVDRNGGTVREVTALDGVEDFVVSPDDARLLVRHSGSYLPPQVAVVDIRGGNATELTDTRTPAYKARTWIQPEYVQVPSKHGAGTIWGKYYGPKQLEAGRQYPIVMFVHGAGYLQNVSASYPNYFREQMFHDLLVQRGYIVIELDYRASEGYGRKWRTDIYRRMGTPELEDYLDGLDWLVEHKQGDRTRAGIYGGSYGGFMTFMALFKKPGVFKAGAALRPVSDWSQYNHEYTSNILNTPELDPEAYKTSSPIEYAAGLQDNLLIAHGMIDDNVFFHDSVMLTQKLIELRKDKWELAPYPLERHGFVHPDSWYDEYRRILALFDRTLQPGH